MQLLRNLWLYVALLRLAGPDTPPEQRAAAGRIASWTPVLLLVEGSASAMDQLERLKASEGGRPRPRSHQGPGGGGERGGGGGAER